MSHNEHHLLSAYQTLWRLSYLFAPQLMAEVDSKNTSHDNPSSQPLTNVALDINDLQAALVSDAQYSVFDLSDAMLAGNSDQDARIILQLKATDEPTTLVLWAISKDMRQIIDRKSVV